MKNVTITLSEDTARWLRIKAAQDDVSVSRWIGELLERMRGCPRRASRSIPRLGCVGVRSRLRAF